MVGLVSGFKSLLLFSGLVVEKPAGAGDGLLFFSTSTSFGKDLIISKRALITPPPLLCDDFPLSLASGDIVGDGCAVGLDAVTDSDFSVALGGDHFGFIASAFGGDHFGLTFGSDADAMSVERGGEEDGDLVKLSK